MWGSHRVELDGPCSSEDKPLDAPLADVGTVVMIDVKEKSVKATSNVHETTSEIGRTGRRS